MYIYKHGPDLLVLLNSGPSTFIEQIEKQKIAISPPPRMIVHRDIVAAIKA